MVAKQLRSKEIYTSMKLVIKKHYASMQLCVYTRIKVELTATETQIVMIMRYVLKIHSYNYYMITCISQACMHDYI